MLFPRGLPSHLSLMDYVLMVSLYVGQLMHCDHQTSRSGNPALDPATKVLVTVWYLANQEAMCGIGDRYIF